LLSLGIRVEDDRGAAGGRLCLRPKNDNFITNLLLSQTAKKCENWVSTWQSDGYGERAFFDSQKRPMVPLLAPCCSSGPDQRQSNTHCINVQNTR